MTENNADYDTANPHRDWKVTCACGAEYTPKARREPVMCYECGSTNIHVRELETGSVGGDSDV